MRTATITRTTNETDAGGNLMPAAAVQVYRDGDFSFVGGAEFGG